MDHILVKAPLTSEPKPRRKRRSSEMRKAELQERCKQLELRKRQVESRIAALDPRDQIAARKRDTLANIVLGAILRSHASLNPSFGAGAPAYSAPPCQTASGSQVVGKRARYVSSGGGDCAAGLPSVVPWPEDRQACPGHYGEASAFGVGYCAVGQPMTP